MFFGVSLLSRRRLSGLPVDFAIGLGPGLIGISALLYDCGHSQTTALTSDPMATRHDEPLLP